VALWGRGVQNEVDWLEWFGAEVGRSSDVAVGGVVVVELELIGAVQEEGELRVDERDDAAKGVTIGDVGHLWLPGSWCRHGGGGGDGGGCGGGGGGEVEDWIDAGKGEAIEADGLLGLQGVIAVVDAGGEGAVDGCEAVQLEADGVDLMEFVQFETVQAGGCGDGGGGGAGGDAEGWGAAAGGAGGDDGDGAAGG
jgi:hypothetical protein